MSFVVRFNVDNNIIIMNEVEFNDNDDDAVAVNEVILMF